MIATAFISLLASSLTLPIAHPAPFGSPADGADEACRTRDFAELRRNPTEAELRCRFGAAGPGRFGLLSYADVPVYQPATPMPGTHLVGVAGHARPRIGESFEEWEWRVLRTEFGPEVHTVHRDLALLDPMVAGRIMRLEARLAEEGIRAARRETWRSHRRQEYLFQQGRSRAGPLATATLTSWHGQIDAAGNPAGRAVDYDVGRSAQTRFHELVREVGLSSFGPDSHDAGHVFLPLSGEVPTTEIALLRTLPRIPEVTLASGLPTDRPLPPTGREGLHAASVEFASSPFKRVPPARLARRPYEIARTLRSYPTLPTVALSEPASEPASRGRGSYRRATDDRGTAR